MDYIIQHHGIKGQQWGHRRFQNEDGSLTPEGKERYYDPQDTNTWNDDDWDDYYRREEKERKKRAMKRVALAAGVSVAAYCTVKAMTKGRASASLNSNKTTADLMKKAINGTGAKQTSRPNNIKKSVSEVSKSIKPKYTEADLQKDIAKNAKEAKKSLNKINKDYTTFVKNQNALIKNTKSNSGLNKVNNDLTKYLNKANTTFKAKSSKQPKDISKAISDAKKQQAYREYKAKVESKYSDVGAKLLIEEWRKKNNF